MNRTQKFIIIIGMTLVLSSYLYPCWQKIEVHKFKNHIQETSAGLRWVYVFWPPTSGSLKDKEWESWRKKMTADEFLEKPKTLTLEELKRETSALIDKQKRNPNIYKDFSDVLQPKPPYGTYYYRIHWKLQIAQVSVIIMIVGGLLWIYQNTGEKKDRSNQKSWLSSFLERKRLEEAKRIKALRAELEATKK